MIEQTPAFGMAIAYLITLCLGLSSVTTTPPLDTNAKMLEVAPDNCIVFLHWSGLAKANAESDNLTEKMIADPGFQRFVKGVDELFMVMARSEQAKRERWAKEGWGDNSPKMNPVSTMKLFTSACHLQTTAFLTDYKITPEKIDFAGGIVIDAGQAEKLAELNELMQDLEKSIVAQLQASGDIPTPKAAIEIGKTKATKIDLGADRPTLIWTTTDRYLVIAFGQTSAQRILEHLDGSTPSKQPKWLVNLQQSFKVDRPVSICHVNMQRIFELVAQNSPDPEPVQAMQAMGLANLSAINSMAGLTQTGYTTQVKLVSPGGMVGLFDILEAKPVTEADLKMIPADSQISAIAKISPAKLFTTWVETFRGIDANAGREADEFLKGFRENLGVDLISDILAHLDDTVCVYSSPGQGGFMGFGGTLIVKAKNPEALSQSFKTIADKYNTRLAADLADGQREWGYVKIASMTMDGSTFWYINAVGEEIPVAPAWGVVNGKLIFALYPQQIKAVIRQPNGPTAADLAQVKQMLAAGDAPSAMMVNNSRNLFDIAYPWLYPIGTMAFGELRRSQDVKTDLNMTMIPPTSSLRPYLTPEVLTAKVNKDGMTMRSDLTLPVNGGVVGVADMALLGMFMAFSRIMF